jgi:hypothetical protein
VKVKENEKEEEEEEPIIGLDLMGEPIIDPAPDKPPTWEDSPSGKAFFNGGNWGMGAGLSVAIYYTSMHSPFGFYLGNMALVLFSGIGLGYIVGALLGWLSVKVTGKNSVPPVPTFFEWLTNKDMPPFDDPAPDKPPAKEESPTADTVRKSAKASDAQR